MKLLIFSDSHGSAAPLCAVTRRERPDLVLHLGDGSRDVLGLEYPPALLQVRGNCDGPSPDVPERVTVNLEGVRLLAVHGHRNGVRQGLLPLHYLAQELGARLVCFGHTHCPTLVEEGGVTFLNPGACSGMHPTYAVAELSDGRIQHLEIKSVEETT